LYGADLTEVGDDTLDGYNVNTFALQVPKTDVAGQGSIGRDPVIGVWSTAERQSVRTQTSTGAESFSGSYVQVSRLGSPLVNEVVVPVGLKDRWNASKPQNDAQFASSVTDPEVPKLIEAIYNIPAPATPRKDLVSVFLTGIKDLNQPRHVTPSEQLRLNLSIAPASSPDRLGVIGGDTAGYPNGRRLADDIVDIDLQVLEGELAGNPNDLGDAVNANDVAFDTAFPYVAIPHSGSATGSTGVSSASSGSVPVGSTGGSGRYPIGAVPTGLAASGLLLAGVGIVHQRRRKATI